MTHEQSIDAMVAAVQNRQNQNAATQTETPAAATQTETPAAETTQTENQDGATQTETQDAGTTQDADEYSFDEDGFTGARDLASKIDAIEALKGALPDDLRSEIMANARIAEALAPYRDIFGSPEEAKIVAQHAQEFAGVQQIFGSISGDNVKQGTSELLNKMLQMSALRDENGQPRRRQDGTYITDGTTTNFLNELFDRKFNASIVKKIQDSGDDAAIAALDLVMERAGLRASTADKTTDQDPAIAARKAELDRQQAEITQQQQAARKERETQYRDTLNTALQGTTDGAITSILGRATGLNDFTKNAVVAKLTKAIKDAIRTNTAYLTQKDQLELQPMSTARHNAEVKLAKDFLQTHLARIARPILAEAGISISKKQGEKAAQQAARAGKARGEVQGSAPAGQVKSAPQSASEAREAVRQQLKTTLGREPSASEINVEMMLNLPGLKGRNAA